MLCADLIIHATIRMPRIPSARDYSLCQLANCRFLSTP